MGWNGGSSNISTSQYCNAQLIKKMTCGSSIASTAGCTMPNLYLRVTGMRERRSKNAPRRNLPKYLLLEQVPSGNISRGGNYPSDSINSVLFSRFDRVSCNCSLEPDLGTKTQPIPVAMLPKSGVVFTLSSATNEMSPPKVDMRV